jgi:hypothetical protein
MQQLIDRGYQVEYLSHGKAILESDFPKALTEIEEVLGPLGIPVDQLVRGGGGESVITQGLRHRFAARGWRKHVFEIQKLIDGVPKESVSHEVDHVRDFPNGKLALEIEWNNKDPFFDRDLENFKRLHAEGAISVGVIITRGKSLQDNIRSLIMRFAASAGISSYDDLTQYTQRPTDRQKTWVEKKAARTTSFAEAWTEMFCNDKYGQATTHWRKLEDRVRRGVGNPCPLLLIGIPDQAIEFGSQNDTVVPP